ncbi:MAG: hypothetical protein JWN34_4636 [Bryobacterales bacterium]|nr:hypothetical protein [Bryobacterales bacterium]
MARGSSRASARTLDWHFFALSGLGLRMTLGKSAYRKLARGQASRLASSPRCVPQERSCAQDDDGRIAASRARPSSLQNLQPRKLWQVKVKHDQSGQGRAPESISSATTIALPPSLVMSNSPATSPSDNPIASNDTSASFILDDENGTEMEGRRQAAEQSSLKSRPSPIPVTPIR